MQHEDETTAQLQAERDRLRQQLDALENRQAAIASDNARLYQEARFQHERLQTTLASIGDAVIATDERGKVSFINMVAQSLTGWTAEEAVGKPLESVFAIINEFTREPVENPVAKVIQHNGIVGLANHTLLLSRDGREIPIDDSGAPIREADGTLIGVILVFRDITERKRQEQRNRLLLELSMAFSNALTQSQIAEVVVEQALRALGGIVGTVCLLVENGTMLEILNLHGLSPAVAAQYRRTPLDTSGPLNDAVRADSIVWIEDRETYTSRYPHFAEIIRRNGSHSTISLPLKIDEKVIGGFTLSFPFPKLRNPEEEGFFRTLAYLCAQSLERARLYEAEHQARNLSEALRDTMIALNSTLELTEVFDRILDNIDRVVQHDVADIMLNEDGIARVVRSHRYAQHGLAPSEEAMQHLRLSVMDIPHLKWVMEHKLPRIIEDTRTSESWVQIHEPDLIRSTLIVPIIIDEEIAGFLNVDSLTPHFYSSRDAERLQTFADQAAVAIRNAQLHQHGMELAALVERQRIARELHDAVSQTLFSANIIAESLPRSWQRAPDQTLPMLQDLLHLTRGAAAEMRVLLVELRPENLVSANLGYLLTQLGYSVQGKRHIDVSLIVRDSVERVLPPEVQVAFYRIAQESLNNIIKHGDAAQIRIRFTRTPAHVTLIITDNGQGFDTSQNSGGMGLKSMRERADLIRAELAIRSKVGLGTQVRLSWEAG